MTATDIAIDPVSHLPSGFWYDLVLVSQVKRLLQRDMAVEQRVKFLEWLNELPRGVLGMNAVSAVEPACDAAMAMLDEMDLLSIGDKCRLMRRQEVFQTFIQLNPSILAAVKLCDHQSNPDRRSTEVC